MSDADGELRELQLTGNIRSLLTFHMDVDLNDNYLEKEVSDWIILFHAEQKKLLERLEIRVMSVGYREAIDSIKAEIES